MAVRHNPDDDPRGASAHERRKRSRPSLLDQVFLSDGRLAWPVAQAAGVHEATFRARLKVGVSPDDAVLPAAPHARVSDGRLAVRVAAEAGISKLTLHKRLKRGLSPDDAVQPVARVRLSDGRQAWPVAKAAGVSNAAFHHRLKAGWSPDDAVLPVGARRRGRKASPLVDALLSNGQPALPVALAAGVSRQKFLDRLRCGMTPDQAVEPVAVFRLSDGRPAVDAARRNGVSRVQFLRRLEAGLSPDDAVRNIR